MPRLRLHILAAGSERCNLPASGGLDTVTDVAQDKPRHAAGLAPSRETRGAPDEGTTACANRPAPIGGERRHSRLRHNRFRALQILRPKPRFRAIRGGVPARVKEHPMEGGNAFAQFIPLILIFVIMYFLLIRPQQKKLKDHKAMVEALRRGDQIVTQGGLIGKVTKVKDTDEIEVELAQGVKVRVVKSTVAQVLSKTEPAEG